MSCKKENLSKKALQERELRENIQRNKDEYMNLLMNRLMDEFDRRLQGLSLQVTNKRVNRELEYERELLVERENETDSDYDSTY